MKSNHILAINLLEKLIATPSVSGEESDTADIIQEVLHSKDVATNRHKNNVWAKNLHFKPQKPTLMLNSHHDTVMPGSGYSRDPFIPEMIDGKLYGLGSNDAGGPLVALTAAFLHFNKRKDMPFNIMLAATAEEEISGTNGISAILDKIATTDCAIIGEPTGMNMAVAEKGLMVLDCLSSGKNGHAARNEGENAVYKAIEDIYWIRNHSFEKNSQFLGPVKMTVTQIQAGSQHNLIPDICRFVVDVRTTDAYTNAEVLEIIQENIHSKVTPRSTRLNPSSILENHPLVKSGTALGLKSYGSPTLSDQALISIPSIKMGPGDSARSHTADEYIEINELRDGVDIYIKFMNQLFEYETLG